MAFDFPSWFVTVFNNLGEYVNAFINIFTFKWLWDFIPFIPQDIQGYVTGLIYIIAILAIKRMGD